MKYFLVLSFLFAFLLSSCSDDDKNPVNPGGNIDLGSNSGKVVSSEGEVIYKFGIG